MNSYVPVFPRIPQLNYKLERMALNSQHMILLAKTMPTIVEKSFFTRRNTCFSVLSFKSGPALKLLEQYEYLNTKDSKLAL